MVVQLMKCGADPSLIDGEGCSCVHLATQFGHTSIVAYLIAKGQVHLFNAYKTFTLWRADLIKTEAGKVTANQNIEILSQWGFTVGGATREDALSLNTLQNGVTKLVPGGPVSLQSLAPTVIKHTWSS